MQGILCVGVRSVCCQQKHEAPPLPAVQQPAAASAAVTAATAATAIMQQTTHGVSPTWQAQQFFSRQGIVVEVQVADSSQGLQAFQRL